MRGDWAAVDDLKRWEGVPELVKWLKPTKDSTKRQYLITMRLFQSWSKMGAKALIDEAEADLEKGRRERGRPAQRLLDYYAYLTEKHETKQGRNKSKVGISPYKAAVIIGALKSFYKNNGFPLMVKLPKAAPRKENRREEFDLPEIKKLLEVLPTQRDRALVLFGLQGGFDVGTVTSLNLGDLQDKNLQPLLRGEMPDTPVLLRVVREKEGVDYETCLGRDAVEVLRLYLAERKRRGEELNLDSPLFGKEGIGKRTGERATPHLVQIMLRKAVIDAGIVTEERLQRADINVYGYHALRGTFSKRLDHAGMPVNYINYMQGHRLQYNGAYTRPSQGKLLGLYKEFEPVL
ncbi:MAG: site-specific integrase, partial [Candidatus Hydrothermarchaeota archaeon]